MKKDNELLNKLYENRTVFLQQPKRTKGEKELVALKMSNFYSETSGPMTSTRDILDRLQVNGLTINNLCDYLKQLGYKRARRDNVRGWQVVPKNKN